MQANDTIVSAFIPIVIFLLSHYRHQHPFCHWLKIVPMDFNQGLSLKLSS